LSSMRAAGLRLSYVAVLALLLSVSLSRPCPADSQTPPRQPDQACLVLPGLEVLFLRYLSQLEGKSVGVVCNHTAVDRKGVHLVDRLLEHPRVRLIAIFTPEHGYRGDVPQGGDRPVAIDPVSGAVVYSLYGASFKPTAEMMKDLDILLYDIQDAGARFYTYISTLGYAMKASAEAGVEFWALDRPDPVSGVAVEGPILQSTWRSFVGMYPIPIRYGLTPGELAQMIAGEGWLKLPAGFRPRVIEMEGWRRALWFDETGLPWVSPSPNMLTPQTAAIYPGTCLLEGTNVSEGRGTDRPFEWVGAPWMDAAALVDDLRSRNLPGVAFLPIAFTPRLIPGRTAAIKYLGQRCQGVEICVVDRDLFRPVATAVHLIEAIQRLHGTAFAWRLPSIDQLYGSDALRTQLEAGRTAAEITASWERLREGFLEARRPYLLY
jgi:uncharacterized protein YbbC (DUF1343 family)